MLKNIVVILLSILFLPACKEYFPEEEAARDARLYGTWVRLGQLRSNKDNPTLFVFTESGYYSTVSYYENVDSYPDLSGIWHSEEKSVKNQWPHDRIYAQARFRNGIWKNTFEYHFKQDTLFKKEIRFDYDWDTLIMHKYQLIYDGPNYIDRDTIQ